MPEKGLGKGPGAGLGALFGANLFDDTKDTIINLPISKVEPRLSQPRTSFDDESLQELADSLKEYGVIQPITARRLESGYYQIIAGERRWRAARLAGIEEVPVRVLDADDRRAMEIALVENLQREDLNPIEEARGYKTLMDEYGLTQEEASKSVGKSRPTLANSLRLLDLSPEVLKFVEEGGISAGHGRALLGIKWAVKQLEAANQIMSQGLSVRQTEALVARMCRVEADEPKLDSAPAVDYVKEAEKSLSSALGRRVIIDDKKKTGRITLEYYGLDDLNNLIEELQNIRNVK
jgi:ParB-like partition proteins